ncbi:hypothetical protein WOLCODRAFT_159621 [Wolfiporia cocos MD-104 SS10]|uniref:Uncharacterized protein n=1 Tax=Wolfiporia cocos (strain MD-104) TaxID=742152 RepID=A0A2H3JTR0_WOLCO|nr:hypothetical protein WOLCODRAFT_159621 [Wolfiporia cocos MD-104 SS10]
MLAQRGSRPDDKSQRSVQLRAPTQAQLKSPTWGNEEDDGPRTHPPAVSRYETRPSLTRVGEAPPALPTAPLDWTTPSCTLPRAPARQGGPTCGGSPLRSRPSPGQRRKHLGSQHNGAHRPPWTRRASRQAKGILPSAHGGTVRLNKPGPPALLRTNNQAPPPISRPKGKPCPRNHRARGSPCASHIGSASSGGLLDTRVQTRTPPDSPGSDKAIPANGRAPAEGHTARATAQVIRHSHKPQPPIPQRIQRKGRAKAHSRQGNPPRTKSNGSAACLNNRATPPANRAQPGRAAGTPQGSKVARGAEHTNTPLGPTAW